MFGSLRRATAGVVVDLDYGRIERIVGKVVRGLAYALHGTVLPPFQQFAWDFFEVEGPSAVAEFGPGFSYTAAASPTDPWEFTLFDSVRFKARLAWADPRAKRK